MLPLRQPIRESLSGLAHPERKVLTWLESHEHGNWQASDQITRSQGLDGEQMARLYVEAVQWADTAIRAAA
jgi:c-di-GMP-related signal transduction protein